jgi:monofunctional biosynthetic peptidoglycan transglycosylase
MRHLFKIMAVLVAAIVLYNLWILGHIVYWRSHNPASAFMNEQLPNCRKTTPRLSCGRNGCHTPRFPPISNALIAAEDAKFADHEGFDWDGIEAAFEKNLKQGRIVAGGSTISQQLAKNLFLSARKHHGASWKKRPLPSCWKRCWINAAFSRFTSTSLSGGMVVRCRSRRPLLLPCGASVCRQGQAGGDGTQPRYYDEHRQCTGLMKKTRIIQRRMAFADLP